MKTKPAVTLIAAALGCLTTAPAATTVAVSGSAGINEYIVDGETWTFSRNITDTPTLQMVHQDRHLFASTGTGIIRISTATGAIETLATRGAPGSPWTVGDSQGITLGPDGRLYFSTAFGTTGSGIYALETTGAGLTSFIPYTGTGYTLNNARDLVWSTAGDLYVTARGGFNATNRPIYRFDGSGAFTGSIATGLTAPQPLFLEGNNLLVGSGTNGTQIRTIDLAGALPSNGTLTLTGGQNILDILRIEGNLYTAHFNTAPGNTGQIRLDGVTPVITAPTGIAVNGMAIIPEPSSLTLAFTALGGLLLRRRSKEK